MLSNWSIFKAGFPTVAITSTVTDPTLLTPIIGNGSLHVQQYDVTDTFVNLYNTTYPSELGLIKGRMRTIIHPIDIPGYYYYSAGFVFMQDQFDLTGGAGSGYYASLTIYYYGLYSYFVVRKFVSTGLQIDLGATSMLYLGPNLGNIMGQDTCFEVEWDAFSGTECTITLRRALNTTNFGLLVNETTVTDTISPLITSVAEGLAFTNGSIMGETSWLLDSTSLVKLL